jgi:uncharacterized short protein YbdD (DUF466 family)
MKKTIITLLLAICWLTAFSQIGSWKAYMAYYEVQQIQKGGDDLFVMASNSLYQYNLSDQSIYTYDKTNGMSDTYITHIKWCPSAKRLIAVYKNSNIDLVEPDGNVINISDLYTKVITGDKTVSSVRIDGVYAYLICGFGIVKVNMERAEIADSYTPNNPDYPTNLPEEDNSDYDKYIETVKTLNPGGPKYNYFGFMKYLNNRLYSSNGDYNHSCPIQILKDDNWTIYQEEGISESTGVSYQGSFCFDVDPSNENHIFAGSRNGLYEYLDGKFVHFYNSNNSPIEPFDGSNLDYELVTGVKYDNNGNLWILNSSAPTTSMVKYNNGTFKKYNHSELMKLNVGNIKNRSNAEMKNIIIDSYGKMWFVNNNHYLPAFYQYDIDNDYITAYETIINQDGIKLSNYYGLRCVTEDLNQNIWIGTDKGLFVFERNEINNGGSILTQIKVPRNDGTDYADYLLANTDISCIAIDGGNRKWIGTNGLGVYLISADNMEQVHHFTSDNSSLLSNTVLSIAINKSTGEVFFGTEDGLCSYMSDATEPATEMTDDTVYAYPNPVDFKNYNGFITITGLTYNADVKILSSSGSLIREGRSTGGTFLWDGRDKNGKRVASGVYMVATATSDGQKGTVCKIAIVK